LPLESLKRKVVNGYARLLILHPACDKLWWSNCTPLPIHWFYRPQTILTSFTIVSHCPLYLPFSSHKSFSASSNYLKLGPFHSSSAFCLSFINFLRHLRLIHFNLISQITLFFFL
jgi:hypothetical protein